MMAQWGEYFKKFFAPNLDNDDLDINDVAKSLEVPLETYEITTQDGYIIQVHRIVGVGKPVLLMHGMLVNSMCWLSSGAESLGYKLHKAGFDVWLGNIRGGRYGCKHISLSSNDAQFWKFTLHEIGTQDIPAILEKIVSVHGGDDVLVDCIGHSMGATTLLIAGSTSQKVRERIGNAILMAPVALSKKEEQCSIPSSTTKSFTRIQREVTTWLGVKTMLFQVPGMSMLTRRPLFPIISDSIINQFVGSFGSTLTDNFSVNLMSNVSIYVLLHFMQIISEKRFSPYDWGSEDGSADSLKHQEYQLSKFTCKTFLFMATNDGLADPSLASEYKSVLPSLKEVRRVDLTHIGFLWGVNANSEVYQPIIKICTDSSSQKKGSGQDEEQN